MKVITNNFKEKIGDIKPTEEWILSLTRRKNVDGFIKLGDYFCDGFMMPKFSHLFKEEPFK